MSSSLGTGLELKRYTFFNLNLRDLILLVYYFFSIWVEILVLLRWVLRFIFLAFLA
jgi:hypothetical protein